MQAALDAKSTTFSAAPAAVVRTIDTKAPLPVTFSAKSHSQQSPAASEVSLKLPVPPVTQVETCVHDIS